MDLSSATPGQKRIITTLDAPLSVAAGAGSGKTFTLTNRIAYALIGDDGNAAPLINGVDEVLAITFSRTGAAEMKSRIRRLLQEEGLSEQASTVEDAWIATIHGMCARILREHALELGIDPGFETIEGAREDELWSTALDCVLQDLKETGADPRVNRLFAWYPQQETPKGPTGIITFLTDIREKTLGLPRGFESVCLPSGELDLGRLLRELVEMGEEYLFLSKTWDKPTDTDRTHLDTLHAALAAAADYQREVDLSNASLEDLDFDVQGYLRVVLSFPPLSPKYRAKKDDGGFFESYRQQYARIVDAILQSLACSVTRDMFDLALRVDRVYQDLKGSHCLDTTDLLRLCCTALETHPEICREYQERFKLIMVDEFQDTDLLQVAIINLLSRNHGANVMTVGDAQQSVYRFRGADVKVFFQHRNDQAMAHPSFEALSLPDNFRSHGDILKFVDAIFARPSFFGEEFLSLQPKGQINGEEDPIFQGLPRVSVDIIESRRIKSIVASSKDACVKAARDVAHHFACLREQGAKPGSMALLLGRMTNVGIYSQALAEAGFECIVTAGSVFAQATEVKLVSELINALADQLNSEALFKVLSSPLFNLSDSALYAIAYWRDENVKVALPHSFAQRFWHLAQHAEGRKDELLSQLLSSFTLSSDELEELVRTLQLMNQLAMRAREHDLYYALHAFFVDSGWLDRLQEEGAEGQAIAANLLKTLEIIYGWQQESMLLPEIADELVAYLNVAKDQPGVLSTPESDYVRIMTIHSSKGLEFDHVAVGEIRLGDTSGLPTLRIDNCGDDLSFLLKPILPEPLKSMAEKVLKYRKIDPESSLVYLDSLSNLDALALSDFLTARNKLGELDDAQRLLYVALTRAVKSLFLSIAFEGKKDFDHTSKGIAGLLYEVFDWDQTFDAKTFSFDYGGSAPALVSHQVLVDAEDELANAETAESHFFVAQTRKLDAAEAIVPSVRTNVVSYSSIASYHDLDLAGVEDDRGIEELADEDAIDLAEEVALTSDEEMFPEDIAALIKHQNATALGTAFHRLAQRLIESREAPGIVPHLPADAIEAQVIKESLSPEQAQRLTHAIARWQHSSLLQYFMGYSTIAAEVPFMIELEADGCPIYLEGEIDGLAFDESDPKHALFIDYKTGGADEETAEILHEKHLLQAQCYALALLVQGFESVEANFIRIERTSTEDPDQPQIVTYHFESADRAALETAVLAAYQAARTDRIQEVCAVDFRTAR